MLVKYTVSEFLSAKGSFSSIDVGVMTQAPKQHGDNRKIS